MLMLSDRQSLWQKLSENKNTKWDMIVVGGGITGAGIVREAARQGWKVLLIEQRDFAWGTSSRSSKMVHGGLRYLAQGDLKLTKQSLNEREALIKQLPGLVDRMGYYLMLKRGRFPGRIVMGMVLSLYDFMSGVKSKKFRHKHYKQEDVAQRFPGIDDSNLSGASYYSDAVTDDARLVLRVLHEAVQDGAEVLNYVKGILPDKKVQPSTRNSSQSLWVEDKITGVWQVLEAGVIVNATGGWVDQFRRLEGAQKRVRPLRGSHLVVPQNKLPLSDVVTLYHPWDKRPVFVFPWEGATVVGTTDLDHSINLNTEPSISTDELNYLLAAVEHQFPECDVKADDIISTFSGVRPVIGSDQSKSPSKERRDHALWCDDRLISVSGGKLTTFRLIALDVINVAKRWLQPGISKSTQEYFFRPCEIEANDIISGDICWSKRLLGRYGDSAKIIIQQASTYEQKKIINTQYSLAECRWSLKNEAILHLDDLLLRRTRLGLLLKNGGEQILYALKPICCEELNWDNERWQSECERYRNIIKQYYSLPSSL